MSSWLPQQVRSKSADRSIGPGKPENQSHSNGGRDVWPIAMGGKHGSLDIVREFVTQKPEPENPTMYLYRVST
jgi:hypothetical protein